MLWFWVSLPIVAIGAVVGFVVVLHVPPRNEPVHNYDLDEYRSYRLELAKRALRLALPHLQFLIQTADDQSQSLAPEIRVLVVSIHNLLDTDILHSAQG
jgi:hypothetical protein